MKRIIIVFLALLLVVPSFSQEGEDVNSSSFFPGDGLKKGYKGIIEAGLSTGGNYFRNNAHTSWNIYLINSYQFNPYLSIGLGIGYLYLDITEVHTGLPEYELIPVFLDCRVNIFDKRISPYFALKCGYSAIYDGSKFDYEYSGGVCFSPTIGTSFRLVGNVAINLDLGYKLQNATKTRIYDLAGWDDVSSTTTCNSICLNLGLSF